MAESLGTVEFFARELARAFSPLRRRLAGGNVIYLFAELGLRFPPQLAANASFTAALNTATNLAADLPSLIKTLTQAAEDEDVTQIIQTATDIIDKLGELIRAIDTIATQLNAVGPTLPGTVADEVQAFAASLPERLIHYVILTYLETYYPILFQTLQFLGIAERSPQTGGGDTTHPPYLLRRVRFDRVGGLLNAPEELVQTLYGWGDPNFTGDLMLERLHTLLDAFTAPVEYIPAHWTAPARLDLLFFTLRPKTDITPRGLELLSEIDLPAELVVEVPFFSPTWKIGVSVKAAVTPGLSIWLQPPLVVTVHTPSLQFEGDVAAWLRGTSPTSEQRFRVFGKQDGTRLEAMEVKAGAFGIFRWNSVTNAAEGDFGFEARIDQGQAVIDLAGSDGFLSSILPPDGFAFNFDVGVGYTEKDGLYFTGSAGLETAVVLHASVGPCNLETLYLVLTAGADGLDLEISIAGSVLIGPIAASVDRIGAIAKVNFQRGNLGPIDLSLDFKPPTGIGLSLDAQGIKGGGFLEIDQPNHRYAGILQLEFQGTISLTAIGLITTKLPGGQEGFSLLILISAEFQPIQLGMGFTLNGVGGLLGYNRTMVIPVLREGVRDNSLKSILFPEDPVANAMEIISDLRAAFPPHDGQFVIGPMAKIGYGTPTLISLELGLVIEIPDPFRIAILGVLKAVLPEENTALIKIQVNFLGTIDFEAGKLTFDASLFDSRLLAFDLSGDMAVRVFWKENPQFLLSVGGFHPAFEPPPLDLPELRRLALQLLKGNNPRLRLETYMAVTSNTVQFGARLELYAAAGSFNVYGFLAFDVLFQFSPFYFIASIGAMLALRAGSSTLASISLALSLEGTTPWKAKGTAKLKLFWFLTVKVRFSKTWGDRRDTLLEDVAVLNRVVEALQDKSNWQSTLPGQRNLLVSLKEIAPVADEVIVHPCGGLTVSQKIVPLNVRIDKFGNAKPFDLREFSISGHQAGGVPIEAGDIATFKDYFAPAQFFKKSDTEKLSADSYVRYDAGFSLGTSEQLESSHYVKRKVEYELSYIDSQREVRFPIFAGLIAPVAALFNLFTKNRANARSPISYATKRKSALAPNAIKVNQEGYVVANIDDLKMADGTVVMASEAEAFDLMNRVQAEQPALSGKLQVIPAFELNEGDVA